ncbi:MAG: hypothetical protein ACTSXQ_00875 [Alphaproteobacteria bacterium]
MLKTLKMLGLLGAIGFALSACGTLDTPQPVGIGRDVNEFKRSPCACNEIPQNYSTWSEIS